jgi:hypothetical protein
MLVQLTPFSIETRSAVILPGDNEFHTRNFWHVVPKNPALLLVITSTFWSENVDGKRTLGKLRHRRRNNIKMYLASKCWFKRFVEKGTSESKV